MTTSILGDEIKIYSFGYIYSCLYLEPEWPAREELTRPYSSCQYDKYTLTDASVVCVPKWIGCLNYCVCSDRIILDNTPILITDYAE